MIKNRLYITLALSFFTVGCHNNAHLRTQKILEPGEKVYSGSGVLATGGAKDSWRYELRDTGVFGARVEASVLTGKDDSESGPYFGLGAGEDGPGFIAGYEYRKYTDLEKQIPKKLGVQIEVDISELGQTIHLRPSLTSTTTRQRPFYSGVNGLLAMGNLSKMDDWFYSTYDSLSGWEYFNGEQDINYNFNSVGAGLTAGAEFLTYSNNSLQFQVDVSLVKNAFNTGDERPVFDDENIEYSSWEDENEGGYSHSDEPILMVTASAGLSFFRPDPKRKTSLEPFPVPSYEYRAPPIEKIIYDPETGLPVPSEPEMEFDPETGEMIQKDTETSYDPETGELIKTARKIIHDPETGMQMIDLHGYAQQKELSYSELVFQAQNAAKRLHNKRLYQSCGAGSCVIYPIGIPAAILYVETGAFSNLNPIDPFYLELNPNQKIVYKSAYKKEEKRLRRKAIYNTQLGCIVAFFGLMIMG